MAFDVQNGVTGAVNGVPVDATPEAPAKPVKTATDKE